MVALACLRPVAVETRPHAALEVADYPDFVLLPVRVGSDAEDMPIRALGAQAQQLIEERGYSAAPEGRAAIEITLGVDLQRVLRRTWSADPGYNGYVERERDEGVLDLRVVDPARALEIWRGASRVRLPQRGLVVGPSREAAWMDGLAELIERLPARAN